MRDWSRREWLRATLLGSAACAASCQRRGRLPLAGEIVGAGEALGHRLRDTGPPAVPRSAWRDIDVVIVGAGVAGLAAARRLQRGGCRDFVVLELEPVEGGTARAGARDGWAFPWGAHYLPLPQPDHRPLVELLEEMNVVLGRDPRGELIVDEESLCRDPQERLFKDGAWHEDLDPWRDADERERVQWRAWQREIERWTGWRDDEGRRAFALPSRYGSDAPPVRELDQITMADWLTQQGWDSPRLRWLVDYACRDDYGMTIDQVSAWAGLFYFCARMNEDATASQPFLTWPEGNGRLVRHLAGIVGERLRTDSPVWAIRPSAVESAANSASTDAARIEVVAGGTASTGACGYRARRVICAAPQFISARLIPGYSAARPQVRAEFQYGSWLVANLFLNERPRDNGFPLAWDNVNYDSPSLGYVAASHQRGIDHGATVLTWYHAFCDDDPQTARRRLRDLTWEQAAEIVLTDLELSHPEIRGLVTRLDVMRWGHAMIRPRPGFRTGAARATAAQPFHGIHFAHTELSGLALFEEAFDQGVRAADEVLMTRV